MAYQTKVFEALLEGKLGSDASPWRSRELFAYGAVTIMRLPKRSKAPLLMSNVTQIKSQIEHVDSAAAKLANEKPGHTLQATASVHEAFLRLAGAEGVQRWDSRRRFISAAAKAMRRILADVMNDG